MTSGLEPAKKTPGQEGRALLLDWRAGLARAQRAAVDRQQGFAFARVHPWPGQRGAPEQY